MANLNKVALLTSGGDSPGMNACIRALVRSGIYYSLEMWGVVRGYDGLIQGDYQKMDLRSVSNIINRGGTILKSARSEEFRTEAGMEKAYQQLKSRGIEALVVIGGDGSFRGAYHFSNRYDIKVIGLPGTIDNDLTGTDYTLGFDTAVNTVIDSVDKIRDTAASHDRCFFIEVMGRDSGCIALWSGLAGGAEDILLPEKVTNFDALVAKLEEGKANNKSSSIILVAEGEKNGGAAEVAAQLHERLSEYETKVTVLGHVQRGGSPTAFDRILAAKFGVWAVESMLEGNSRQMVGIRKGEKLLTPLALASKDQEPLDMELLRINRILAT